MFHGREARINEVDLLTESLLAVITSENCPTIPENRGQSVNENSRRLLPLRSASPSVPAVDPDSVSIYHDTTTGDAPVFMDGPTYQLRELEKARMK